MVYSNFAKTRPESDSAGMKRSSEYTFPLVEYPVAELQGILFKFGEFLVDLITVYHLTFHKY